MNRLTTGIVPILALVVLLLISLTMMGNATDGTARFDQIYSLLLVINAVGLLLLCALIIWNLVRLLQQVRAKRAGARLTSKLVIVFALLAFTPVVVVYQFSLKFLYQGIDSWFDVRIEQALNDAIELGRTALEVNMREHLKRTKVFAEELNNLDNLNIGTGLDNIRRLSGARELTLFDAAGKVVASSNEDPTTLVPNRPNDTILLQVRKNRNYIGLDPIGDQGLSIRVVVNLPVAASGGQPRALQALYPFTDKMSVLANSVESAYGRYRELAYLRKPLKISFTLTLSLVLLLTLLSALWAAFYSARRVVAPLRDLAEGTRAVAGGDLETRLAPSSDDEIGFLLESFNDMTQNLKRARDQASASRNQVESQRRFLEAVLARLSTGVITLDADQQVYTCNAAAAQILDIQAGQILGRHPDSLSAIEPNLEQFSLGVREVMHGRERPAEILLETSGDSKIITLTGTTLASPPGYLLVFDDITALVRAQREVARSEVARRLAHEIKNPLTPIQLSAERLRHKYLERMHGDDRDTLDRLTRTIVQQVEAMKGMVNAFSDYARTPVMQVASVSLNNLVQDVVELYRNDDQHLDLKLELDPALPDIQADENRLRQILHNLIKNAFEASDNHQVLISTHYHADTHRGDDHERPLLPPVELRVRDRGPGFPPDFIPRAFDPYVTTKTRGSGLGLAIVKKIVEEHGGAVQAMNASEGPAGAIVKINLPVEHPSWNSGRTTVEPEEYS